MDLVFTLLLAFCVGSMGGLLAGLGLRWGINRRIFQLEIALGDTQRVVKSLKGADYSATRWAKKTREDTELEALMRQPVQQPAIKYDNDFSTGREG